MKLRVLALQALGLIMFVSCQKGYNPVGLVVSTGGGGSASGALLVKAVSKGNNDETTVYEYDAAGRIAKISVASIANNILSNIYYRYQRDAAGKITSFVTNALGGGVSTGGGLPDSITINVHYPAGSDNFDYTTYSYTINGSLTFKDSSTYVYANGKITDVYEYFQPTVLPVAVLQARTQYGYSNNNVSSIKIYVNNGGSSLSLTATLTYDYDDKTAALYTGNEAFLSGENPTLASKNNVVKVVVIDNTGTNVPLTVTNGYQYNANTLPVSGTSTENPGNKISTLEFTYK